MTGLGEVLKSIRLEKNVKLKVIAEKTNIGVKFLRALENEEFEKIPGRFHFVNYLKSYLQVIQYNEKDFFQTHQSLIDSIEFKANQEEHCYTNLKYSSFKKKKFLLAIFLLAAVLILLSYLIFVKNLDLTLSESQMRSDFDGIANDAICHLPQTEENIDADFLQKFRISGVG